MGSGGNRGNVRVNQVTDPHITGSTDPLGFTANYGTGTVAVSTDYAYSGTKSLKLAVTSAPYGYLEFYGALRPLPSGVSAALFSARIYQAARDTETVYVGIEFYDSAQTYLCRGWSGAATSPVGSWYGHTGGGSKNSYTGNAAKTAAYYRPFVWIDSIGATLPVVYIDDLHVELLGPSRGGYSCSKPFYVGFAGDSSDTSNVTHFWEGAANASRSIQVVKSATNLISNPGIESATTNYSTGGGASGLTRSTADAFDGSASLTAACAASTYGFVFWDPEPAAAAGDVFTSVWRVKGSVDRGVYMVVDPYNSVGSSLGGDTGQYTYLDATWAEVATTGLIPSGAATTRAYLGTGSSIAETLYIDHACLMKGVEASSIEAFNGATTSVTHEDTGIVTTYAWDGTAWASTSTATADPNTRSVTSAFFNFDVDAQGWTASGTNSTAARTTGVGENGSAALQGSLSGRNKTGTATFTWTGTWADLGIPAGKVVTMATLSSIWLNTSAYSTAGATNTWDLSITAGGNTYPLMTTQSATGTGVKAVPAQSGVAVSGGPSDPVTLTLTMTQSTGSSNSAVVTMQADSITLNLKFSTPILGNASLAGAGALSATGVKIVTVTGSLSGSGALSTSGPIPRVTGASVGLSGAGTLSTSARITASGSGALSGSGTLANSGRPAFARSGALDGAGALTATGARQVVDTLALAGTGTLVTSGVPSPARTLGLSGAGTLTPSGKAGVSFTGAFAGSGALTAAARTTILFTLGLSGSGALTADGVKLTEEHSGDGSTSGSGTLTAAGSPRPTGTLALSGAGALGATLARLTLASAAGLTGSGALSGSLTRMSQTGATSLGGLGALGVAGAPAFPGTVALAAEGTLTGQPWYSGTMVAVGATASGIGWVNASAATGFDDSTFATWTSSTPGAVSDALVVDGFGIWDNLPADADIQKVTVRVKGYSD